MSTELLEAALTYARNRWHVFPIVAGAKNPHAMLGSSGGHHHATTDESQIRAWWTIDPTANIGIALAPSGLVVLDVDVAEGKPGRESLEKLDAEAELPATLTATTGRGGTHAIYSRPAGVEAKRVTGFRPGLDLLGDGYIVAAPSKLASGGAYSWNPNVPIAELPPALQHVHHEAKPKIAAAEIGAPIPDGVRNDALFRAGCAVRATGIGRDALHATLVIENKTRCNPPLDDAEVERIVDSVMGRVEVTRDAAMSAVVAADMRALFPPTPANTSRIGVRASSVIAEIRAKANLPVVLTPWSHFNDVTGGLELNSITLAVGYQGSGKSSQAAQLASHHARSSPVVYYLGEMGARIFVARIVGQQLRRPWRDVLRGHVSDPDMQRVLEPLHLYIVPAQSDPSDATRAIVNELSCIKADGIPGVPLVIIDYVQLLAPAGKDMRQGMIQAVRDVQTLTENSDVVSWVLSQGSRSSGKRIRDGAEDSIDLADTGAETAELERAATLMFALAYQQKDDTRVHEVTMAVGKRRFGGPTKLYFDYDGEIGLFLERGTPVKSTAEQQREDAILENLRIHSDGTCAGLERTPCVARMSLDTLYKGFGATKLHRVGGKKEALIATLKRLEAEHKIVKLGPSYSLVQP